MHELKLDLTPRLRGIEITSVKGISGYTTGAGAFIRNPGEKRALLFRGKGLEFEKFREFCPDDDAQMIDWKASLRAHKLLVKAYTEEQNKDVVFFLDVSSSMSFSSIDKLKCEYAAELIASMAFSIIETGDNMGLVMFADTLKKVVIPAAGIGQYFRIIDTLRNPKFYEGSYDLAKSLKMLLGILSRRAIILIISDFIGLKGEWKRILEIASARFEIIGVMIRDPIDQELPEGIGQVIISDPYTEEETLIDVQRIRDYYKKTTHDQSKEVFDTFSHLNSDLLILKTDESFVNPVRRFFMGR